MYYMKNITLSELNISPLGIVLQSGAFRDTSEFATRTKMQEVASYLNDLVYTDKIILLNADMKEYSKVECVQIISNGYEVIVVNNIAVTPPEGKYYFVKGICKVNKAHSSCIREFKGNCQTLFIISSGKVNIKLSSGAGLILSDETLEKRQTLELDFGGRMKDLVIQIDKLKSTVEVEVFIDGYSYEDIPTIQTFIDNWDGE